MEYTADIEVDAEYLKFSEDKIKKTFAITADVLVDVDLNYNIIGIESLKIGAAIPVAEILKDYRLPFSIKASNPETALNLKDSFQEFKLA